MEFRKHPKVIIDFNGKSKDLTIEEIATLASSKKECADTMTTIIKGLSYHDPIQEAHKDRLYIHELENSYKDLKKENAKNSALLQNYIQVFKEDQELYEEMCAERKLLKEKIVELEKDIEDMQDERAFQSGYEDSKYGPCGIQEEEDNGK